MHYPASLITALILGLAALGCSGDGKTEIHGTVTMDATPIENGTIQFLAADGQGPTASAKLENGQYSVRLMPGKKKVKIEGYKTVRYEHHNNQPDAPLLPVTEPIVPARFNRNSELTCDVTAGKDQYDFDLKSK